MTGYPAKLHYDFFLLELGQSKENVSNVRMITRPGVKCWARASRKIVTITLHYTFNTYGKTLYFDYCHGH